VRLRPKVTALTDIAVVFADVIARRRPGKKQKREARVPQDELLRAI
jgi:hypothetical protein